MNTRSKRQRLSSSVEWRKQEAKEAKETNERKEVKSLKKNENNEKKKEKKKVRTRKEKENKDDKKKAKKGKKKEEKEEERKEEKKEEKEEEQEEKKEEKKERKREEKKCILQVKLWPDALLCCVWDYLRFDELSTLSIVSTVWNNYFIAANTAERHPLAIWTVKRMRRSLLKYYGLEETFWEALRISEGVHSGSGLVYAIFAEVWQETKDKFGPQWHPGDLDFYIPVHKTIGPNLRSPLDEYLLNPFPGRTLKKRIFKSTDKEGRRPADAVDGWQKNKEMYQHIAASYNCVLIPGLFATRQYEFVMSWDTPIVPPLHWPEIQKLCPEGLLFTINIIYIDLEQFRRMRSVITPLPRPSGVWVTSSSPLSPLAHYIADTYDLSFLMNVSNGGELLALNFPALRSKSCTISARDKWDWSSEWLQHPEGIPSVRRSTKSLRQRIRHAKEPQHRHPWATIPYDPCFQPRTTILRCLTYTGRGFDIYPASTAKLKKGAVLTSRKPIPLTYRALQNAISECYQVEK